ncbi:MAG: endonuclease domain-containing protein [Candidatus Saganbacteria bacterium]|nr:endonuclease domain-containing protein [Candidatus Saganbacteria bacterium]
MRQKLERRIKETIRNLRRTQTKSETILWQAVRDRQLAGKKILRQHPIVFEWMGIKRFVVADFYCHEVKLIIELDGGIHDKRKNFDEARDTTLQLLGYKVIRFRNERVLSNLSAVLKEIESYF